jgi:hypothetical protein
MECDGLLWCYLVGPLRAVSHLGLLPLNRTICYRDGAQNKAQRFPISFVPMGKPGVATGVRGEDVFRGGPKAPLLANWTGRLASFDELHPEISEIVSRRCCRL